MADYIKRDSVTNLIKLMEYPNGVIECYADEFISDINAIPSADVVEVRHGKWVNRECSECGGDAPFWPMATTYYRSNFCPHCGADMRGGT